VVILSFATGDIVRHFKYELCSDEERLQNKYVYYIKGTAEHTETKELLILYQALYAPFTVYARPCTMFYDEVDRIKYPTVKQRYRFEKI
jgi:hypothetical protein